ncbi:unnamed protein product [Plutella xylostella]|uniref:(diamondback moth) hypothetical protein n=1 Tax=Plutella xylostella TaxID=51655 RepID=A0A8S4ENX5_PLUXY|nr:unnamed protein product [Plutella xylostella]
MLEDLKKLVYFEEVVYETGDCCEARTHSIERREANPEVNYDDQPLSDAAADDDTQNDADQGDEEEDVNADIQNKGEDFKVGLGMTLRLPCVIQPSPKENEAVAFQWLKDGAPLFLGTQKMGAPDRMSIDRESQTDLIIADLQMSDAGKYKCDIFKQNIEHTVRFEFAPKIIQVTATNRGQVIEGSDMRITCNVSGSPPPKLIWSREDVAGENHGLSESDGEFTEDSVYIRGIRREQAGKYLCYADNNVGKPAVGSISIKVLGKPRVHVHKTIVNSAINVEAILQCSAHEEPPANIYWYKDGRRIEDSAEHRYSITVDGQHSNLTVVPVGDSDFGEFTCEAENQYGKHNRSIELVQSPVVEGLDAEGAKLSWTVHSHQPLEKIHLELRQLNGDGASKTLPIPIPSQKSHEYEIVYVIDDKELDLTPGKYEAMLTVKNQHSWSDRTGQAVIEIEGEPLSIQGASVYRGASTDGAFSLRPESILLSTVIMYLLVRLF